MRREQFTASIYKIGINPYVEVPKDVSDALGEHGYVPIVGSLNGQPIRATLVPIGEGRHRLFINGAMRKMAGVDVGDWAEIALEMNPSPRIVEIPEELEAALDKNERAKTAFYRLTPSRRKEILQYLYHLKNPASLEKNVEKVIRMLLESN